MNTRPWAIFAGVVVAQLAFIALAGWQVWSTLGEAEQAAVLLWQEQHVEIVVLAVAVLFSILGTAVSVLYRTYLDSLSAMAEQARTIAVSNPGYRVAAEGPHELVDLANSINLLAERYQVLGQTVEERIHKANVALEEERNTLGALVSKLTHGVVVCTNDGRILLYNGRAQRLLESAADRPGQTDWIGLGRSIHGVLDAGRTLHALDQLRRRLDKGQTDVLVPFVATTSGGRLLSAHMVPILAADAALRGYLLTLDDVTGQLGSEDQRERLLRTLLEDQRGAVAGIRSAIETLVAFPDIDAAQRRQFHAVIDGDAARLSARLEQFEKDYGAARSASLPTEALLVSDLLAEVNGHLQEARGLPVEVEVPVEPVWIRADRYLICQCVLFLVDRLIAACRASDFAVSLQSRGGLVALYLEWTGSPLHGEAMKLWGNVALSGDGGGGGHGTLFEAIERLGGAVWPLRASPAGRPCIRLVLPAAEAEAETAGGGSPSASSHAFDFRLFDHDAGAASADLPLSRVACTVVDTETTGLEPGKGDEIIAVGAVRIVNGRLLRGETFDTLVKPRRTGTGLGEAIHGITQQMLRGQPAIEEVLPRLHRFVADTVVVGHDVAFDMRFFEEAGTPLGCAFTNPTLDTLLLDSVVNPRQKDKRLAAIAERLGVTVIGRHTALGDALTTAEVFLALVPLLEANGIRTLAQARAAAAAAPGARISY